MFSLPSSPPVQCCSTACQCLSMTLWQSTVLLRFVKLCDLWRNFVAMFCELMCFADVTFSTETGMTPSAFRETGTVTIDSAQRQCATLLYSIYRQIYVPLNVLSDSWPTIRNRSLTQCHQCSCPRPFINAARHPVWRQSETSRSSPDWPRMAGAAQSSVASLVFHALLGCAEAVPASRLPRLMSNDPKSISKILFFFCRSQFSGTHRVTWSRREWIQIVLEQSSHTPGCSSLKRSLFSGCGFSYGILGESFKRFRWSPHCAWWTLHRTTYE